MAARTSACAAGMSVGLRTGNRAVTTPPGAGGSEPGQPLIPERELMANRTRLTQLSIGFRPDCPATATHLNGPIVAASGS